MSPDLVQRYLAAVEEQIRLLPATYVEKYEEEILASDRVNLRIRVRFSKGNLLELNEAFVVEAEAIRHLCYRYHYQDEQRNLIFRYDNTPHFPNIETHPHHKHLPDEVVSTEKPSILAVIEEANENR